MIKRIRENVKVTRDVGWLIPGLNVKRWLFLIFLGSVLMVLGFLIIFDIRPIYQIMEFIRKAALVLPTEVIAIAIIFIGAIVFFSGWKKTTLSIMDIDPSKGNNLLEKIDDFDYNELKEINELLKENKQFYELNDLFADDELILTSELRTEINNIVDHLIVLPIID